MNPRHANPRHSKATKRWGSPEDTVERCRRVMGAIDFDPCSEAVFQAVVQATQYYSLTERGEDGTLLPWHGRSLVNPPGGLIVEFWEKMQAEARRPGGLDQCVWVGFSVEQLCILAGAETHPMDFSLCILRKRLGFRRHDGFQGSPSHGNYVCGIGVDHQAFAREFGPLGRISAGRYATGTTPAP